MKLRDVTQQFLNIKVYYTTVQGTNKKENIRIACLFPSCTIMIIAGTADLVTKILA